MSARSEISASDPLAHWREALTRGELQLQYCPRCHTHQHYPRQVCANCWHDALEWRVASGEGQVYSYTIARVPTAPALADKVPYVIAIVELAEGPRVTSNIIDCAPDTVCIGMTVQAVFAHDGGEASPLQFCPKS